MSFATQQPFCFDHNVLISKVKVVCIQSWHNKLLISTLLRLSYERCYWKQRTLYLDCMPSCSADIKTWAMTFVIFLLFNMIWIYFKHACSLGTLTSWRHRNDKFKWVGADALRDKCRLLLLSKYVRLNENRIPSRWLRFYLEILHQSYCPALSNIPKHEYLFYTEVGKL